MKAEFVGPSARDDKFPTGGTSRLINGYREPMVPGGRAPHVLRAVPGMQSFASIPAVFARAAVLYDNKITTVVAGRLWSISADGALVNIGDVQAADDIVSIAVSTGIACVVSNRKYWTWNGTTLANPTTGAVTDAGSVAQLGNYVLVSEFNGRRIAWSNLAAPGTFGGLNFKSAEITAEPIIRLVTFKDALFVFKAGGYETWTVTGLSGPDAFARIDGAQGEPGLLAYNLVTTFPNGMAWVGTDGRLHVLGVGPISTPPLEVAIETLGPKRLFFYEQRGHGFICLTFEDAPAWCYDTATGEWHERDQNGGPWLATLSVKMGPDWYLGTDVGRFAKLGASCTDFGRPMVRRYVSNTIETDERFVIDAVEAFPRLGDVQGDGTPAKITLKMSRDAGMTWGTAKDRDVGTTGAWENRLVWRGLGQFRRATLEVSQTGPVDIPMLSTLDVVTS